MQQIRKILTYVVVAVIAAIMTASASFAHQGSHAENSVASMNIEAVDDGTTAIARHAAKAGLSMGPDTFMVRGSPYSSSGQEVTFSEVSVFETCAGCCPAGSYASCVDCCTLNSGCNSTCSACHSAIAQDGSAITILLGLPELNAEHDLRKGRDPLPGYRPPCA
jgi:hypothetical protein